MLSDYEQPYQQLEISELIKLENSLETFSRNSFDEKIPFIMLKEIDVNDFLIFDEKNNKAIIFTNILETTLKNLSMSRQIVGHWLTGETTESSSDFIDKNKNNYLSKKEIELFLQGSKNEIMEFHKNATNKDKVSDPSLDWIILHYPIDYARINKSELEPYREKVYKLLDKEYSLSLAYGVVSKKHYQRTDKQNIIDIFNEFLSLRGYDSSLLMYGQDTARQYEPIMLWISENYYKEVENKFKAALGINFGYDNGLSSYRYAIGVIIDDLPFNQINYQTFRDHFNDEDGLRDVFDMYRSRWIHHKKYGELEKKLPIFFEESYDKLMKYLDNIFSKAKNHSYRPDKAINKLDRLHNREFSSYKEDLQKHYEQNLSKYGHTKFNQFISWLKLAKDIKGTNKRLSNYAEFVATCTIGHK